MVYNEKFEEKAAQYVSDRNELVAKGYDLNSPAVNRYEERASRYLSRAKGKVR